MADTRNQPGKGNQEEQGGQGGTQTERQGGTQPERQGGINEPERKAGESPRRGREEQTTGNRPIEEDKTGNAS